MDKLNERNSPSSAVRGPSSAVRGRPSDIAIRVENLSKLYRIGAAGRPRYETLYDKIAGSAAAPVRKLSSMVHRPGSAVHGQSSTVQAPSSMVGCPPSDFIWALKDVSFEVKRGEVVGIIGRNGAGKSTLLKILSRITEPTEGRAEVYGRIGSLLEVGTGFHPELTGRENIYLNGAILGMKRAEIDRKFDEIVAFSEIEKFLDTPVKFYSSGMYVRLAFAVAAHMDPEILLVDEVLAVGDAAFQKKCLGKMGDVAGEGRTVLFVSHNMAAIKTLCGRSIWLDAGRVMEDNVTERVISSYIAGETTQELDRSWTIEDAPGNDIVRILHAEVRPHHNGGLKMGDSFDLIFTVAKLTNITYRLDVTFHLVDEMGTLVFVGSTARDDNDIQANAGVYTYICRIPAHLMHEGQYTITRFLILKDRGRCLYEHRDLLNFSIENPGQTHLGWMGRKEGVVQPQLTWHVERSPL